MKYRKKPVVIDAVQYKDGNFEPVLRAFPESFDWKAKMVEKSTNENLSKFEVEIPTLEGTMIVSDGDWIIKGVKGEFYPCKPEIFEMTYEKVEE
jgi:hypothetical protein